MNNKPFSFETIEKFDEHINSSIKGYSDLIEDVINLSEYFIEPSTKVYDIGCSTGRLVRLLGERYKSADIIGIEKEPNFIKDLENKENVSFIKKDIFDTDDMKNASLVTSIFTLQFIKQHKRSEAVQKIFKSLNYGAAFILCEKMMAETSRVQDMLTFMYYDHKRNKFNDTEILNKEFDLRHQMKLYTLAENIEMLKAAGFRKIEIFWKRYTFTGIIAIK